MRFGNRKIFRSSWSLARAGARRFGGSPALYIASALALIYADARIALQRAPSAIKTTFKRESNMRIFLTVAMIALALVIAPVTHASVAVVIAFMIPSYIMAQIAVAIWQWESPRD